MTKTINDFMDSLLFFIVASDVIQTEDITRATKSGDFNELCDIVYKKGKEILDENDEKSFREYAEAKKATEEK